MISIFDVESTDELDQIVMAGLPIAEYLTFEQILPCESTPPSPKT